jgi:hypothetical protein
MTFLNKLREKIGLTKIFLLASFLLYFFMYLFSNELFFTSVFHAVKIIDSIALALIFVYAMVFCFNLFFDAEKFRFLIRKDAGKKGWALILFTGVISSGPIYLWYPLLAELKEKGMRDSFSAAFLFTRAIKPPLIPLLIHYFGFAFVGILTFWMIIFSVINGVLVEKILEVFK